MVPSRARGRLRCRPPEEHPNFIAWANEPDDRGWRYSIRYRAPFPGYGWARHNADGKIIDEHSGAFYDGTPDHPEGGIEWARASANAHREKVRRWITELEAL